MPTERAVKSSTAKAPDAEERLVQSARSYADEQKRKNIKWFTSKGPPVATAADNEVTSATRNENIEQHAAQRRLEDRTRTEVSYNAAPVAISKDVHPLHTSAADLSGTVNYSTVAVNGMEGRKVLFHVFEQMSRILILRNRLDTRLQILNRKENARIGIDDSESIPQLPLLDMSVLPTSVTSSQFQISQSVSEVPSSATVSLFAQKELATPFEFRNQQLKQVRFSDHPFQNADLLESIDVLPAGVLEAPQSQQETPSIEHFVQPVITLETFPVAPFAFDCAAPFENGVRSDVAQRVTDGGFRPAADGIPALRVSPYLRSDPLTLESVATAVPRLLQDRPSHHDMSDSDDDGDDLPQTHPNSLEEIGLWLKDLGGAADNHHTTAAPSSNVPIVENALRRRREACDTFVVAVFQEISPQLQLQF